jgi:heptosyltransferase-2
VVALGAEKDEVCDRIASAAGANAGSRSLRGQTDIRTSMAIISLARWVIGNDTGMVHVAEALGKDVAMVEGPTHEWMGFSPYREKSLLLGLPLICRPCSKSGRICVRGGTRKCLRDLKVPEVAGQLRQRGFPC